jgi:hypothetical protein
MGGEGHEKESGRILILEVNVPRGFSGKDLVPALLEQ